MSDKRSYWNGVSGMEPAEANPDCLPGTDSLDHVENNGWLEAGLGELAAVDKELIVNYYGLFKNPHLTYRELGEKFTLSVSSVQKRIKRALKKLRRNLIKLNLGGA